jgi:Mn2+/Fe2+ NRAMP family transporter
MGVRLTMVTRKGLGDLIRENFGVKSAVFVFIAVAIANMGTIIVDMAAFKTTADLLHLPSIPLTLLVIIITFLLVTKGDYKMTQNIMLLSSFLYFAYIFSAIQSAPDWGLAFSNLALPNGVDFTPLYIKDYIIVGLGVLGTTITPWGQFFISSFSLDKNIDTIKLKYSQIETYWGAFLTDFFSFFMIVATAATLYVNNIPLTDGTQAAMAIEPFAGKLAATLFAVGIMNAGFMGIVVVGLSTTYAFSEFFGFSRSLDTSYKQSRTFYKIFAFQLIVAFIVTLLPGIDLFKIAISSQILNAIVLPPIFIYLIKFTSSKKYMGEYVNSNFQKWIAIVGTIVITGAAIFAVVATLFGL